MDSRLLRCLRAVVGSATKGEVGLEDIEFGDEVGVVGVQDDAVEMTKPVVSPLFNDKKYFVKKVKDTRNYLVHKEPHLKKKAADDEELYWITKTLSYLVRTCLLVEVGLTAEDCFMLFSKNRDYKFALEQASAFGPQNTS